ncbi:MAG: prolyl oligopeptidase family serine peptidase [Candidatus Aminicenantes bacterium]|nr:prolyl oligopeptidase family serine peptidase [Candidatus Aminicenantes bacterium]NIM83751.1 prolyl oligopeptidase family serine peptidase [Candidatus Aminicenantes bacterium]NIN23211.1 prolyl oligopeptidase family serine peptidase [Candidatus Aminicenantes bacterium]NIN46905.1 prolyl oligopeptidase family serine peptidase [Candidatus Aminicenantes bacterium]NIN89827.1 prolyl oligopeptidase family serine peptidase [Candidatus Aminicenantes bacterium]
MTLDLPTTPGIYEKILTLESGIPLRYTLSIPASFSEQQPVPLVMALHFGGTVTSWYGKGYLITLPEPALRELGAIIAAPDCPTQGWNNPISETAILELLDHLKNNYNIDEKRILITGFSMGGTGTWHMAARHPQIFSAAIPISSAVGLETIKQIKDIPLYVIHSRQDEVFPIKHVQEMVQLLKDNGVSIQFEIIDGVSHYNTGMFVESLKEAVPWLKKVWKM